MQKISLEQWRMFIAVVDSGGFSQAGDALFKTQSTVSHSIKKLEQTLGKPLFDIVGRKAVLTAYGQSLLSQARRLTSHANALEHDAISQKFAIHSSLHIAVDTLFPRDTLSKVLNVVLDNFPNLNIQLYETTLSRCGELLEDGTVDIGIASKIPKGYTTVLVSTVDLYASAHSDHDLSQSNHLTLSMLENHRQIVIRDAGLRNNTNSGWLGSSNRLTVSSVNEALNYVKGNLGYAWLPEWVLNQENNEVSILSLQHGQMRTVALQLAVRENIIDDLVTIKVLETFKSSFE
ncbi:LysR family transcriptional regulator [Thalassotalea sp. PP2-459]|uniref:LysR family transcriptional regulator n=1 Tax=Thalassotalea sp. PP2-459 TaxID=1742724 RepID=UPI0009445627|nr:LysR family transcriptional regulator [Thalassotalea sp. PP2-459]OKY25023.1 hypothetical protein BI291_17415 [Thalassotalea sp. PP2-459]